jgi:hypothetical protein
VDTPNDNPLRTTEHGLDWGSEEIDWGRGYNRLWVIWWSAGWRRDFDIGYFMLVMWSERQTWSDPNSQKVLVFGFTTANSDRISDVK